MFVSCGIDKKKKKALQSVQVLALRTLHVLLSDKCVGPMAINRFVLYNNWKTKGSGPKCPSRLRTKIENKNMFLVHVYNNFWILTLYIAVRKILG